MKKNEVMIYNDDDSNTMSVEIKLGHMPKL